MLLEFKEVRQHEGSYRRYFFDDWFDLYLWYDRAGGRLRGFQLVYDKTDDPHSLTWTEDGISSHNRVDDGESGHCGMKMSPILVPDGVFPGNPVLDRFAAVSKTLDPGIREFVEAGIRAYGTRAGMPLPAAEAEGKPG